MKLIILFLLPWLRMVEAQQTPAPPDHLMNKPGDLKYPSAEPANSSFIFANLGPLYPTLNYAHARTTISIDKMDGLIVSICNASRSVQERSNISDTESDVHPTIIKKLVNNNYKKGIDPNFGNRMMHIAKNIGATCNDALSMIFLLKMLFAHSPDQYSPDLERRARDVYAQNYQHILLYDASTQLFHHVHINDILPLPTDGFHTQPKIRPGPEFSSHFRKGRLVRKDLSTKEYRNIYTAGEGDTEDLFEHIAIYNPDTAGLGSGRSLINENLLKRDKETMLQQEQLAKTKSLIKKPNKKDKKLIPINPEDALSL